MHNPEKGERFSRLVNEFQGRLAPEPMRTAGYSALIDHYHLKVPLPSRLAGIAERHHKVETIEWELLTPRHAPADNLSGHLEFALKWEGVELAVLSALFRVVPDEEVRALVQREPTGAYARRLWFLYEWLTHRQLDVAEPGKVRAIPVLDPTQQFGLERGVLSSRHKVLDNLPGTSAFCPLVRRTEKIEKYLLKGLDRRARDVVGRTHADVMRRAAAFILLYDSRASFQIEGEKPSPQRAERWAKVIGEAGSRELTVEELERLQRIVIGDTRFVTLGLRTEGGFVGTHDRKTQEPIPVHISARAEDLKSLMAGVVAYDRRTSNSGIDPVVVAAGLSFGFVYIHPFEDGNGRLHRWLIHHTLAIAGYNPPGVVFPVSAAIYRDIARYKSVLESYSRPLLGLIEWEPTAAGNVQVLNETGDYYRYFDATAHTEFLYDCVEQTIERDLPEEVAYLEAYDRFANGLQKIVDMPERKVNLLHLFIRQGMGRLSKRARSSEFAQLTDAEVEEVEKLYKESFAGAGHEKDNEMP
ncbi:MAG: Fic family protein [Candidatus Acidiferrales bacterium]